MKPGILVCHLSFNHSAFDDRIYWKELLCLQRAGYKAVHICVGKDAADYISAEGIRIISIKAIERNDTDTNRIFNTCPAPFSTDHKLVE